MFFKLQQPVIKGHFASITLDACLHLCLFMHYGIFLLIASRSVFTSLVHAISSSTTSALKAGAEKVSIQTTLDGLGVKCDDDACLGMPGFRQVIVCKGDYAAWLVYLYLHTPKEWRKYTLVRALWGARRGGKPTLFRYFSAQDSQEVSVEIVKLVGDLVVTNERYRRPYPDEDQKITGRYKIT